jgi:hypothetical protein
MNLPDNIEIAMQEYKEAVEDLALLRIESGSDNSSLVALMDAKKREKQTREALEDSIFVEVMASSVCQCGGHCAA